METVRETAYVKLFEKFCHTCIQKTRSNVINGVMYQSRSKSIWSRVVSSSKVPMKKYAKKNPVAKNLNKFNKPATHVDRKKRDARGYRKHKGESVE